MYGGCGPCILARHARHGRRGNGDQRDACDLRATFGETASLSANDAGLIPSLPRDGGPLQGLLLDG